MAYPKIESENKNWIVRTVSSLKFWSKDSTKSEIVLPNHEAMQSGALLIYLEEYTKLLYDCSVSNIEKVSREIANIFIQLSDCFIWIAGYYSPFLWKCEGLTEVNNYYYIMITILANVKGWILDMY